MKCSIKPCERDSQTRGWCAAHYHRWLKWGDPMPDKPFRVMRMGRAIDQIFLDGLPSPLPSPSECWEWCGTRSHYGVLSHDRRNHYAHRIAWERAANKPVPDGMVVRHTCDNKFCVNHAHLILGTQSENVRDAVERRINCRGERHGRRALTEVKVREIKRLLRERQLSQRQIADLFPEITTSAIEGIASGRTWSWVEAADYPLPS